MERIHLKYNKILLPELIFKWDGLYPITNSVSKVLSFNLNNLIKAEYVAFLVALPLNKGYCNNHLSISTFNAILLSIDHEVKKLIDSFGV